MSVDDDDDDRHYVPVSRSVVLKIFTAFLIVTAAWVLFLLWLVGIV